MKKVCLILLLILMVLTISAQEKPVITVLDFSVNNVSKSDMRSIISLFSSALFRTDKYTVIDVSRRDEILNELQFSLSGCSDESCQLELGKMLSAEQIVVGDIGSVGNRYILTSKILETETGRTLKTSDGIYKDLDALIDDIFAFTERLTAFESPEVIVKTEPDTVQEVEAATITDKSDSEKRETIGESDSETTDIVKTESKIIAEAAEGSTPAESESVAIENNESPNKANNEIQKEPKVKKDIDVRKVTAWSSVAVGAVSTVIGGYLFYDAVQFYNGTVDPAYQDYMNATADFDTYWNTYTGYQDDLKTKAIIASALTGGGLLLAGLGVTLFILPEKVKENTTVAFFMNPVDGASTLALSYSY